VINVEKSAIIGHRQTAELSVF